MYGPHKEFIRSSIIGIGMGEEENMGRIATREGENEQGEREKGKGYSGVL